MHLTIACQDLGGMRRIANIRIGDKWNVDPSKLVLRSYEETGSDLAALTAIRNETLHAVTLPEDYA